MDHMEILRQELRSRIGEASLISDTAEGDERAFVLGKLSALYEVMGFIAGTNCGHERQVRVVGGWMLGG